MQSRARPSSATSPSGPSASKRTPPTAPSQAPPAPPSSSPSARPASSGPASHLSTGIRIPSAVRVQNQAAPDSASPRQASIGIRAPPSSSSQALQAAVAAQRAQAHAHAHAQVQAQAQVQDEQMRTAQAANLQMIAQIQTQLQQLHTAHQFYLQQLSNTRQSNMYGLSLAPAFPPGFQNMNQRQRFAQQPQLQPRPQPQQQSRSSRSSASDTASSGSGDSSYKLRLGTKARPFRSSIEKQKNCKALFNASEQWIHFTVACDRKLAFSELRPDADDPFKMRVAPNMYITFTILRCPAGYSGRALAEWYEFNRSAAWFGSAESRFQIEPLRSSSSDSDRSPSPSSGSGEDSEGRPTREFRISLRQPEHPGVFKQSTWPKRHHSHEYKVRITLADATTGEPIAITEKSLKLRGRRRRHRSKRASDPSPSPVKRQRQEPSKQEQEQALERERLQHGAAPSSDA